MQSRNASVYWILVGIAVVLACAAPCVSASCRVCVAILAYLMLFGIAEGIDYFWAPVWSQTERTISCYDWFQQYLPQNYDKNFQMDYVESLFDGDFSRTIQEATMHKYSYMFDKLQLRAGLTLLDMGCGTGVWMEFCKQRGVDVTGLTLSSEQARAVERKGIKVHVSDYRQLVPQMVGRFDRVTFLGSTEHNCSSRLFRSGKNVGEQECNKVRQDLFALARRYLKGDGKMFIATLVRNTRHAMSFRDLHQIYIMDRFYGGRYSNLEDYSDAIRSAGFVIDEIRDTTQDYHYSSIAHPDFFGCFRVKWHEDRANKLRWLGKGILTDPFLIHKWLYYSLGTWQWQFGSDCKTKKPLTDHDIALRAVSHNKYFICTAKHID